MKTKFLSIMCVLSLFLITSCSKNDDPINDMQLNNIENFSIKNKVVIKTDKDINGLSLQTITYNNSNITAIFKEMIGVNFGYTMALRSIMYQIYDVGTDQLISSEEITHFDNGTAPQYITAFNYNDTYTFTIALSGDLKKPDNTQYIIITFNYD